MSCAGSFALEPSGDEGFGYDPIFVPEGESKTVAELGNAWKETHSHRARAARALRQKLCAANEHEAQRPRSGRL